MIVRNTSNFIEGDKGQESIIPLQMKVRCTSGALMMIRNLVCFGEVASEIDSFQN